MMLLHAIWDTSSLLLWTSASRTEIQPLAHDIVRDTLGNIAGDALLAVTAQADVVSGKLPGFDLIDIPVLRLSPAESIDLLASLPHPLPSSCSDSVRFYVVLSRLVTSALVSYQFYPSIRKQDSSYIGLWQPLVGGRTEVEQLERYATAMPAACRCISAIAEAHPLRLVETFLTETTDKLIRRAVANDPFFARVHQTPSAVDVRWLSALLGNDRLVAGEFPELQQFSDEVHAWLGIVTDTGGEANLRLCLELREPPSETEPWPVKFQLVGEDEEETLITADELWQQTPSPLTSIGRSVADRQQKFTNELRRAMEYFPSIERIIHMDQPKEILLSPIEAFAFMRNWSDALDDAGIVTRLPDWAAQDQNEISLRLSISPSDINDDDVLEIDRDPQQRNGQPITAGGRVGLDSLVHFDWRVAIGQTQITAAEFESLVNRQSPLVKFRDRWLQIDVETAQKAAATIKRQ